MKSVIFILDLHTYIRSRRLRCSKSEIKVMRLVLARMEPLYMEFGFFESISRSSFCIVRMSHKCNTVTYPEYIFDHSALCPVPCALCPVGDQCIGTEVSIMLYDIY